MTDIFRVISLGWGLQSFTITVMSALGELPRIDAVVHWDNIYENALDYGYPKYRRRESMVTNREGAGICRS